MLTPQNFSISLWMKFYSNRAVYSQSFIVTPEEHLYSNTMRVVTASRIQYIYQKIIFESPDSFPFFSFFALSPLEYDESPNLHMNRIINNQTHNRNNTKHNPTSTKDSLLIRKSKTSFVDLLVLPTHHPFLRFARYRLHFEQHLRHEVHSTH